MWQAILAAQHAEAAEQETARAAAQVVQQEQRPAAPSAKAKQPSAKTAAKRSYNRNLDDEKPAKQAKVDEPQLPVIGKLGRLTAQQQVELCGNEQLMDLAKHKLEQDRWKKNTLDSSSPSPCEIPAMSEKSFFWLHQIFLKMLSIITHLYFQI